MPCYQPLIRALDKRGNQIFYKKEDAYFYSSIYEERNTVPCRQCYGCRMRKRLDWTLRGVHELQTQEVASFITLTFDQEHVPDDWSIQKEHLQKFFKRLRKRLGAIEIRYYACGEYGEISDRPHYHAIIYGYDFPDKEQIGCSKSGNIYYTSPLLAKCWKFGFNVVADVSMQSIAYVAKYSMKKITGDAAAEHYIKVNRNTGEEHPVQPEFQLASRNPALGRAWFERYTSDVFPSDEVVHEGKQFPVPQYYLDLLEKQNPDLFDLVKHQREYAVINSDTDITVKRLAEMERVKIIQQEKFLLEREHKV